MAILDLFTFGVFNNNGKAENGVLLLTTTPALATSYMALFFHLDLRSILPNVLLCIRFITPTFTSISNSCMNLMTKTLVIVME